MPDSERMAEIAPWPATGPDKDAPVPAVLSRALSRTLTEQIEGSLWLPLGLDPARRAERNTAANAALAGIAPRGEAESLLAVQMVAVHGAGLECLRRALLPESTFRGIDLNLRHGARLLAIYTRQMEALARNRERHERLAALSDERARRKRSGALTVSREPK